jgi:AraC-like DNA-binding protein
MSEALPARDRFEAWRETFALKVARVDVATPDARKFRADMRLRAMPRLGLSKHVVAACSLMRTPGLLRDGDDAVGVAFCVDGSFRVRFDDHCTVMKPGQAILLPNHRLCGMVVAEQATTFAIRMDRDLARRLIRSLDTATLRPTAPDHLASSLLRAYCDQLVDAPGELDPATAGMASAHLEDLVAHVFADREAAAIGGGLGAARLCAIKDDIARNLDRQDLSVGAIAARHQVTPRYIQKLFESEGTTLTDHVLEQRLARAYRLLSNPRHAAEKISAIAFDCGFGDLSYFYRSFRRHYGATPSDVRAQSLILH